MTRRNQKWTVGDVFVIKTLDNRYVAAQIVGREAEVLNSVTIAVFDEGFENPNDAMQAKLDTSYVISVVFSTRDSLDRGIWHIVGNRPVMIPKNLFPYEHLRGEAEWVGAIVHGSGIINEFVNAYYGLLPWDDWADPAYLDKLLVKPDKKPTHLVYKSSRNS